MFCHVGEGQVVGVHDVSSVYHVPLLLESQGIIQYLQKRLNLTSLHIPSSMVEKGDRLHRRWKDLTSGRDRYFDTVSIVLVGKYTESTDAYMSVQKSLEHAAFRCHRKLKLTYVESSHLEPETLETSPVQYHEAWRSLVSAGGVLVPGGFGIRGTEGMILAIKWAREQSKPFLGVCLGFQLAVVEWARNVCGLKQANSSEFDAETPDPVVIYMPEISKTQMGGTMRLGLRATVFGPGSEDWSKIRKLYAGKDTIWERHRHRYEVSPQHVKMLKESGLEFIGTDERGERMQVLELKNHPYFVGLQAHPEFSTRPLDPSPPFLGFVAASCDQDTLAEQMENQLKTYVPPHPEASMVLNLDSVSGAAAAVMTNGHEVKGKVNGVAVNGIVAEAGVL